MKIEISSKLWKIGLPIALFALGTVGFYCMKRNQKINMTKQDAMKKNSESELSLESNRSCYFSNESDHDLFNQEGDKYKNINYENNTKISERKQNSLPSNSVFAMNDKQKDYNYRRCNSLCNPTLSNIDENVDINTSDQQYFKLEKEIDDLIFNNSEITPSEAFVNQNKNEIGLDHAQIIKEIINTSRRNIGSNPIIPNLSTRKVFNKNKENYKQFDKVEFDMELEKIMNENVKSTDTSTKGTESH